MTHPLMLFAVFPLAAYVIGSTPFGPMIGIFHGVNIRRYGSGNVGATNVARLLGKRWGYLCFALDVAKGFVPVFVAGRLMCAAVDEAPAVGLQWAWLLAAVAAICGHVLSFWLGFRGGKGVATGLGAVCGVWPYLALAGLAALAVWIIVTVISRYVSLGSIVAAAVFFPLFLLLNWLWLGEWEQLRQLWPMGMFALAMPAMIIIRHRGNISRLLAGTESKTGQRIAPAAKADAEQEA